MRSLFLLVVVLAAGCSSKSGDDVAASAKSAASAASAAAASAASTAADTAKKAADTAAEAADKAGEAADEAGEAADEAAEAADDAAPASMAGTPVTGEGTKIVGVWKIDLKSLEDDPRLAKMEGPAKEAAMAQAKQMMGQMTVEFTNDGQMVMALNPQMKMQGTFVVKSVEGNAMVVETTMKQGQQMKTETVNVTVDATSLKLKGPTGQEIAFTK